jgi:quinolinate synthase
MGISLSLLERATASEKLPASDLAVYRVMPQEELIERCWSAKRRLGQELLILGHHYQQDEVIQFADLRGDSYKLSSEAAKRAECRYIVFCGVHFMAETADILTPPEVIVILPDLAAGCSMADMADLDSVESCWEQLGEVIDLNDVLPITYINSSADLKAFCGKLGGLVCTSSNASCCSRMGFCSTQQNPVLP